MLLLLNSERDYSTTIVASVSTTNPFFATPRSVISYVPGAVDPLTVNATAMNWFASAVAA